MERVELEQIIEKAILARYSTLSLNNNQITILPNSIGDLGHNLLKLHLNSNCLTNLPESIGNLFILTELNLADNSLLSLPMSIGTLTNLRLLNLNSNHLTDLSIFQNLPNLEVVVFLDVELSRRYWTKLSDWKSEWLLDEDNTEIRRVLIKQLGYEKICDELGATTLDNWREYTLLRIDGAEVIYDGGYAVDEEPMLLLKMTCPSTGHIHILRVPPEMTNAEAAITWVNHGIHPDKFAVQT